MGWRAVWFSYFDATATDDDAAWQASVIVSTAKIVRSYLCLGSCLLVFVCCGWVVRAVNHLLRAPGQFVVGICLVKARNPPMP